MSNNNNNNNNVWGIIAGIIAGAAIASSAMSEQERNRQSQLRRREWERRNSIQTRQSRWVVSDLQDMMKRETFDSGRDRCMQTFHGGITSHQMIALMSTYTFNSNAISMARRHRTQIIDIHNFEYELRRAGYSFYSIDDIMA